jgi:hypothetical protein
MDLARTCSWLLLAAPLGCAAAPVDDETASASGAQSPKEWLQIEEKDSGNVWEECSSNEGGAAVMPSGGDGPAPESPDGASARSCLGEKLEQLEQDVSFGTIAFLAPPPSEGGCLSLSCAPKKTLVVEVTKGAEALKNELGFSPLAKKVYAKAACEGVPFAVDSGFGQLMGSRAVHEFAESQNIDATKAGIGFTPGPGCGYRAMIVANSQAAEGALEKQGFRDVTK